MDKELYVIATLNQMRECFREFEPLFEKISKINCFGTLKNGLTLRFTADTTGLRYFKYYSEVKEMLCEMATKKLQQELDKYKNIVDELERYIKTNYDYYTEVNDVNLAKKYVYKDLLDKIKNLLKGE